MTSPHSLDKLADQATNEPTWTSDAQTHTCSDDIPTSSYENPQVNHTESSSRKSRVKFRHERKKARRCAQRQQDAIERRTRAQQKRQALEAEWALNPALKVVKKIEKEHAQAEYERQKKQWETREREIEQANQARKAAEEARQRREEQAIVVPSGQGSTSVFEPGRVHHTTSSATTTSNETLDNPSIPICPSYAKTASCRFGIQCSLRHPPPPLSSKRLLIRGLFATDRRALPADLDDALEHDDDEEEQRYQHFYLDLVAELAKYGSITQFKVCRNKVDHLRGNVYIEYNREEEAAYAIRQLRGRWYAGKRLFPELVTMSPWSDIICTNNERGNCIKGDHQCQLLHIYRYRRNTSSSLVAHTHSKEKTSQHVDNNPAHHHSRISSSSSSSTSRHRHY
ncbi:hypothetical protein BDF22DRAFT_662074 [Syncephalis plumigaleata]|nr:hypothetical protein BDF22DRAFT_662074 [Syncephalis plumigaleata]